MKNTVRLIIAVSGAVFPAAVTAASEPEDASRAQRAELSADALARTQYMEKAKGFTVTDGTNSLKLGGWTQFRYFMNFRDNPPDTSAGVHDSGFANGFELSRTRLNFSGNVLDPNLKFKFEGDFNRASGDFILLDAFSTYVLAEGWTLKGGQFKGPLLREELVSDTAQLAIERSVVNSVFSQTRTQGVNIEYLADSFRGNFSINDGMRTLNTTYNNSAETDIGLTGRIEAKWGEADWKIYDDFTSFRSQKSGGMVGLAGNWQHDGNTASPGTQPAGPVAQTDLFVYTADISFEGGGWNAFVAGVGQHFDGDNGADGLDDFGLVAQGGVFISESDELIARWDAVFPDSDRSANENFNTLTFGWNHYFIPESHALVASANLIWYLDAVSDDALVVSRTGGANGLLPSNQENQVAILFQFQMMF